MDSASNAWQPADSGQLARTLYRLAVRRATGVLALRLDSAVTTNIVLRHGQAIGAAQQTTHDLERKLESVLVISEWSRFEGGVKAYPPGPCASLCLTTWLRQRTERALNSKRSAELLSQLAGFRLAIEPGLIPLPEWCDETDLRILEALAQPRHLDQVWQLSRTPRFRLLSFLQFLNVVGALQTTMTRRTSATTAHASAQRPPAQASTSPIERARQLLGVTSDDDHAAIRRRYHRLARALHPDTKSATPVPLRFEEVTRAYRLLVGEALASMPDEHESSLA